MADSAIKKTTAPVRPVWSSSSIFILAVSGATVGLSNISLYPLLIADSGGAAFLILYLLSLLVIGLPMVILEMVIGRTTASNPVSAIEKLATQNQLSAKWSYIGLLSIFAGFLILSFYSVVAGWSMAYAFRMMGGVFVGVDATGVNDIFNSLLGNAESLVAWHTLFVIITGYTVARGIKRGIERWVRVLMPAFFAMLATIFIAAVLLTDFVAGMKYFLNVRFEQLFNLETVLAALGMAFFSLSLGRGAIMAFSSYLPQSVPITRTAISIVLLDIIVILLAGLAIFPIMLSSGRGIDSDANVIFEVLPMAFASMPLGSLLGTLFFLMLFIAAITSAIALLDPIVEWMAESKSIIRKKATTRCALIVWLLGLGTVFSFNIWSNYTWTLEVDLNQVQLLLFKNQSFFDIVEYISSKFMLPISGFMLVIFAGHLVNRHIFEKELTENQTVFKIWYFTLQNITPLVLFIVLLNAIGFLGA